MLVEAFHQDMGTLLPSLKLYTMPGTAWVFFWNVRGLLGQLPAFSVVSLLLPSSSLNFHLSPCCQPIALGVVAFACGGLPRQTVTVIQKWGFVTHSGQPKDLWEGRGLLGRLLEFPVISLLLPSTGLNLPVSHPGPPSPPCGTIFVCGDFRERHRHPAPKLGALLPARNSPGIFRDRRGLLGRLTAFNVVSPLLPFACLNVPLNPCSLPTPPCSPIFAFGGLW